MSAIKSDRDANIMNEPQSDLKNLRSTQELQDIDNQSNEIMQSEGNNDPQLHSRGINEFTGYNKQRGASRDFSEPTYPKGSIKVNKKSNIMYND